VIGLSSPHWTDDELLRELRDALQEPSVDERHIRAAQAAFTWRTVDADLEILGLETELAPAGAAQVRGSPGSPRMFTFHGERLSVEIEIDEDGIVGQLTPPGPARVILLTTDGPQAARKRRRRPTSSAASRFRTLRQARCDWSAGLAPTTSSPNG
jgi:hypothetical protein